MPFQKKVRLRLKDTGSNRTFILTIFLTTLIQERIFPLAGGVLMVVLLGALGLALNEKTGGDFGSRVGQGIPPPSRRFLK